MFTTACNFRNLTPFEAITGEKPDISHVGMFGCNAFLAIPKDQRDHKLAERATEGILAGFVKQNSYKIYIPRQDTYIVSRDVHFLEGREKQKESLMEIVDEENDDLHNLQKPHLKVS